MDIYVGESPGKGRGVFAGRHFRKGEIIETCSVIVLPCSDLERIDSTILYDYYYAWGEGGAIALGLGSLYNHSYHPNAMYKKDLENRMIIFICIRDISEGEEITLNYNGEADDQTPLWFENK